MALNKNGIDLKAIRRDQKKIDSLPNKGRVSDAMTKAIHAKKSESQHDVTKRNNRLMISMDRKRESRRVDNLKKK